MQNSVIYTIGHSIHPIEVFIEMLESFKVNFVIDIRRFPGSLRNPQFSKNQLSSSLATRGIGYLHLEDLGGRRNPIANSNNSAWRVKAFRGYADYMESQPFQNAILMLQQLAIKHQLVFMCSEAVWWSCHRSLVSDYLKAEGWTVIHIMGINKSQNHPYTKAAKIVNGKLSYRSSELFNQ